MRAPLMIVATIAALAPAACASSPPPAQSHTVVRSVTQTVTARVPVPTTATRTITRTVRVTPAPATSSSVAPVVTPPPTTPPPTTSSAPPAPSGQTVVVLNPGHNGDDANHPDYLNRQVAAGFGNTKDCETTGTATNSGYPEHAFNWDVVLRTAAILRAHHITVVLTRHSDTGVGPCVDKRAYIGNHPDVAAVVSVHGDGAPAGDHGFFVNTAVRQPWGASDAVMQQNGVLAQHLRDALAAGSGLTTANYIGTNGIYATDKFAALNLSTRPAAFLEIGNMRNAGDAAIQSSADGRQRIAQALANGILAYVGGA